MISHKTFGSALGVLVSVVLSAFASEESPTTRISVMSDNIENGSAQVGFNSTAEAIKKAGAWLFWQRNQHEDSRRHRDDGKRFIVRADES